MSDKEKRYPTRMHEALDIPESEVIYGFKDVEGNHWFDFFLQTDGLPYEDNLRILSTSKLTSLINHPERILRKPRLTQEQVKQLGALVVFDRPWIAKDKDGSVFAFKNKPGRNENKAMWIIDRLYGDAWLLPEDSALADLVSWSDPEPLDIVATLKANGVEIEEDK